MREFIFLLLGLLVPGLQFHLFYYVIQFGMLMNFQLIDIYVYIKKKLRYNLAECLNKLILFFSTLGNELIAIYLRIETWEVLEFNICCNFLLVV